MNAGIAVSTDDASEGCSHGWMPPLGPSMVEPMQDRLATKLECAVQLARGRIVLIRAMKFPTDRREVELGELKQSLTRLWPRGLNPDGDVASFVVAIDSVLASLTPSMLMEVQEDVRGFVAEIEAGVIRKWH